MSDTAANDDSEPHWDALPNDPVAFFGLSAGFNRTDLKRSYNRLIRRFKPERQPAEFQRIRSAYEDLERSLRYGESAPVGTPTGESVAVHQASSTPTASRPDYVELLQTGQASVDAVYSELASAASKSADDYYALAILVDAHDAVDDSTFFGWLLEGLRAHPGDPGLSRLVYAYLVKQTPVAELSGALSRLSEAVPDDHFYPLAEGGFERLVRERGFDWFNATLTTCEENLRPGDGSITGRLAFYVRLLRYTLWDGTVDWNTATLDLVESNFDQLPEYLHNELDLIGILREYTSHRLGFIATHPLRERLDAALREAFTMEQLEADRSIYACQLAVRRNADEVGEAFPIEEDPALDPFYTLWSWVSMDAAERLAEPSYDEPDYGLWRSRVHEFLLTQRDRNSWDRSLWGLMLAFYSTALPVVWGVLAVVTVVAAIFGSLYAFSLRIEDPGADPSGAIVLGIVAGVPICFFAYRRLKPVVDGCFSAGFRRLASRCYRRLWRPAAFEFLERTCLDYFLFRGLITENADRHQQDDRGWISGFIQQDFGLAVYALGHQFRE